MSEARSQGWIGAYLSGFSGDQCGGALEPAESV
jgi:hypothetical protein